MVMEDDISRMKAAIDQFSATIRDTFVPAVVEIEKAVRDAGGSEELALEFAFEYGKRMMDVAKVGRIEG